MEFNFDKLFKISTTALFIIGWDPRLKRDMFVYLRIAFLYCYAISYFSLVLYNIICHDLKNNNFVQTCTNATHGLIFVTCTFNIYVMMFHRNPVIKLIDHVVKDYAQVKNLTADEQLVVKNYANQGAFVCKQWLVISMTATGAYVVKNMVLHIYYYWINEYFLVPLYDVTFPKVIDDNKDMIFVYVLIYMYLLMHSIYMSIMLTAYAPLGPIMMLHACGQLEIVKRRIDNLFEELDADVIQKNLKTIIEQLQNIYNFVDMAGTTFRIAYEWALWASSLIVPVAIYAIIETTKRGEVSIDIIVFVFGGLIYSSLPCYYSDLLMEKGEELRMSLYTCGWERHYVRGARTSLAILLLYALRPVAIKTVFKTLNLDTLTGVFRQSYTIFNLMNAVFE